MNADANTHAATTATTPNGVRTGRVNLTVRHEGAPQDLVRVLVDGQPTCMVISWADAGEWSEAQGPTRTYSLHEVESDTAPIDGALGADAVFQSTSLRSTMVHARRTMTRKQK